MVKSPAVNMFHSVSAIGYHHHPSSSSQRDVCDNNEVECVQDVELAVILCQMDKLPSINQPSITIISIRARDYDGTYVKSVTVRNVVVLVAIQACIHNSDENENGMDE